MIDHEKTFKPFNTVAKENRLTGIYKEPGVIISRNFLEFIGLSRSDLAQIFGIKVESVRLDERMPSNIKSWLKEIANLCELVAEHFYQKKNKDFQRKTELWLKLNNPGIQGKKPVDLIKENNLLELYKFLIG